METALIIYSQVDNVPTLVDLYENETISLQFNFSDIKDLKPRGSYSRTFRIPATQNNGQLFGFVQENTYQFADFNPKRKLNAIITVDTIPILEGSCQFKASYTSNGEVSEYEIVFFGNVIDFFKNVGDADFKVYIAQQLQTDYNFIVSYDNIQLINDGKTDIHLGLTDRGQNWVGNVNDANSRSINSTDVNVVAKAGELTPFVSARYIFNKIMSLSGFQLGSNSTTLTDELDYLYIPFVSESAQIQQGGGNPETAKFLIDGYNTPQTFNVGSFANETVNGFTNAVYHLPTLTEQQDAGNNIIGNVYTVPFSGNYTFNYFGTFQVNAVCDYNLTLRLLKTDTLGNKTFLNTSGSVDFWQFNPDGSSTNIYHVNEDVNGSIGTTQFFLQAGETIEPVIVQLETAFGWSSFTGTFKTKGLVFQSQEISKPLYGNAIDWSANAPVMKCSEFMDSLFKMYNLVVVPNKINAKIIDFIPMTEYISQGSAKDWTSLLDISKDITLTATTDYQARKNNWTYKQSTDLFNDLYNSQGNRVYGRLELIDPENDFATDEQKIELYFGPTPIVPIKGTSYAIPKFVNEQYQYTTPTPRILYKTGQNIQFNVYNEAGGVNYILARQFSHYSDFVPTITSRDLNFGQETPLCVVESIPYKTLYACYWNEYIANIYAPDARVLEAFFSLDFADIYNFNFNDKIFIKDSYWRILSISDYVVGQLDTVKVTLIKQVTAQPDCLLTPVGITAGGAVIFHDVYDNPADATQECCNIYNYNWIDGGCYAFSRDSSGTLKPKGTGLTSGRVTSSPPNTNTKGTMVATDNNFVGLGNDNSIVLGSGNRLTNGLDSVLVTGYNANVLNGGATLGSGGTYTGEMQSGVLNLWGKGNFTNSSTAISLLFNGSTMITMPDNCIWLVKLRLIVGQTGALIDASVSGEYNLHIAQSGGTISLKNVTTIDETPIDIDGRFDIS
jgi:hypothetical protein